MAYLRQDDPRWVNLRLGNSPYTVGVSGCTVTDLAMYIGTTPDVVVQRLMAVGGLTQDGLVIWAKIAEAFPGVYIEEPYFRAYNNDEVKNNTPCLVEVDYDGNTRTIGNHWVLYIGNQQLVDPLDAQVKPTSSYPAVLSYRAIKGAWQQAVPQPTQDHYFVDETGKYKVDYNNLDSLKVTFDAWVRLEKGELVDKGQLEAKDAAVTSCQTQLESATNNNKNLQEQIVRDENTINGLRINIETLQKDVNTLKLDKNESDNSVIALKLEIAEIHKQDADYGKKAIEATELKDKLENGVKEVMDALEKTYNQETVEQDLHDIAVKVLSQKDNSVDPFLKELVDWLKSKNVDGALETLGHSPLNPNNLQDPGERAKIFEAIEGVWSFAMSKDEGKTPDETAVKAVEGIATYTVKHTSFLSQVCSLDFWRG
jgi:hypothetical protein